MVCDVSLLRSRGEVLHENQSNLHFEPELLSSCVVMNIIKVLPEGALHVAYPTKSGP